MDWSFVTQPASLIGIIGIAAALQKSGVDIVGLTKWLFNQNKGSLEQREIQADMRNALQPLLSQMEELSQYANHDTTSLLVEIRDLLKVNFSQIHSKHEEWDRRGIPTEDCKK